MYTDCKNYIASIAILLLCLLECLKVVMHSTGPWQLNHQNQLSSRVLKATNIATATNKHPARLLLIIMHESFGFTLRIHKLYKLYWKWPIQLYYTIPLIIYTSPSLKIQVPVPLHPILLDQLVLEGWIQFFLTMKGINMLSQKTFVLMKIYARCHSEYLYPSWFYLMSMAITWSIQMANGCMHVNMAISVHTVIILIKLDVNTVYWKLSYGWFYVSYICYWAVICQYNHQ